MNPNRPSPPERTAPSGISCRLAGLVSSGGSGLPATNDGPIEIILMAFLGAFIGLLLGFTAGQVSRFCSMFGGHAIGRASWGAYGAVAGAVVFAVAALIGRA